MNLEMQTALLNTYPPKLIAKILKALREQFVEQGESIEVETLRPQQRPNCSQRIVRRLAKMKLADRSRSCTELKMLPTSGNLIL